MVGAEERRAPICTVEDLRVGLETGEEGLAARACERITDLLVLVARRFMRSLKDPGFGPEDMAQEAWCRSLEWIRSYIRESSPSIRVVLAYLSRTVGSIAIDATRAAAHKRRVTLGGTPRDWTDPAIGVITRVHRADRCSEVMRLVEGLKQIYREAWLLRHVECHSPEDAAVIAGVTPATLRQRAHRAAEKLRGQLDRSILDELD